jgi:hypothetical protein
MNANGMFLPLALGAILLSVGCGEAEQSAARTNECVDLHGRPADVSQEPDYDAEWVHRWSYEDGCHVRKDVIMTREGDGSCGDGQASEIVLGAKEDKHMRDIKIYQRDPENIYNDTQVSEAFDASVQLPDAAIDTGYQQGDRRLWLVPEVPEFIYVQLADAVEKWPHDPTPPGCD